MIQKEDLKKIPLFNQVNARRNQARKQLRKLRNYAELHLEFMKQDLRNLRRPLTELPVPPTRLRNRVHGATDLESFLRVGQRVSNDLVGLVKKYAEVKTPRSILDFGCGCGRITRFLKSEFPQSQIEGIDLDAGAIGWNKKHLPHLAGWTATPANPPTHFKEQQFDFIFGISVFTHLDEMRQNHWLKELKRLLKPQGLLILSTLRQPHANLISANENKKLKRDGVLFFRGWEGGLKPDELPDFYQTCFHSESYIRKHWKRYFEIVAFVPKGINQHQDAVILR